MISTKITYYIRNKINTIMYNNQTIKICFIKFLYLLKIMVQYSYRLSYNHLECLYCSVCLKRWF